MSEATIASGIRTALKAMSEFADADVVDNDYSILDQNVMLAPYVIVGISDFFMSRQDAPSANEVWEIPVTLVENFTDWQTTLQNIRTRRQAIIDMFNTGDARSAGGLEAVSVNEIRSHGEIMPVYPPGIPSELLAESDPVFVMAHMIVDVEEF